MQFCYRNFCSQNMVTLQHYWKDAEKAGSHIDDFVYMLILNEQLVTLPRLLVESLFLMFLQTILGEIRDEENEILPRKDYEVK